jgi:hypothetical protein
MKTVSIQLVICVILYFAVQIVKGQDNGNITDKSKVQNLIPPSPEAASLGKYGNTSVNMFTGKPNISIPLFEMKGREISIPISLSYDAGGIKVEEIASSVGLGWTLQAGGVITRTVNGDVDENPNLTGTHKASFYEEYSNIMAYISGFGTQGGFQDYNKHLAFEKRLTNGEIESQPDIFFYNFPGHSGKVFIDGYKNAYPAPYEPVSFAPHITTTAPDITTTAPEIQYWEVVDEIGNHYYFEFNPLHDVPLQAEKTRTKTFDNEGEYNSSWYLSYIISANYKDTVVFEYEVLEQAYQVKSNINRQEYRTYLISTIESEAECDDAFCFSICEKKYKIRHGERLPGETGKINYQPQETFIIHQKQLKSIEIRGVESIEFEYSPLGQRKDVEHGKRLVAVRRKLGKGKRTKEFKLFHSYFGEAETPVSHQFDLSVETSLRLRLDSIQESSYIESSTNLRTEEVKMPAYTFDYFDEGISLPHRESLAQDHWGYYNGANNSSLLVMPSTSVNDNFLWADRRTDERSVLVSTLEKITYPTRGSTTFEYEAHEVDGEKITTATEVEVNTSVKGGINTELDLDIYTFAGCLEDNNPRPKYNLQEFTLPINAKVLKMTSFGKKDDCEWGIPCQSPLGSHIVGIVEGSISKLGDGDFIDAINCEGTTPWIGIPFTQFDFTNGSVATIDFTKPGSDDIFNFLGGKTYTLVAASIDPYATVGISLYYIDQINYTTVGGLRIATITDYNENNEVVKTRKYEYTNRNLSNPASIAKRSGELFSAPRYEYESKDFYMAAYSAYDDPDGLHDINITLDKEHTCVCLDLKADGQAELGRVMGNHVGYGQVIEYEVDKIGRSNGAKVFKYQVNPKGSPSYPPVPDGNLYELTNGQLLSQETYRYDQQNKSFVLIAKDTTIYSSTPELYQTVYGVRAVVVRGSKLAICSSGTNACKLSNASYTCEFGCGFEGIKYYVDPVKSQTYNYITNWIKPIRQISTQYDLEGNLSFTQTREMEYANPFHAQPTQIKTFDSRGRTHTQTIKYSLDYYKETNLSAEEYILYSNMVNRGMKTIPVSQQNSIVENGSVKNILSSKTTFTTQTNALISTQILPTQISYDMDGDGVIEDRVFQNFNSHGFLQESYKENGEKSAYLWTENKMNVTCVAKNTSITDISYTSFESGEKGNWAYNGTAVSGLSKTGKRYYVLSGGNIRRIGLVASNTYQISFWAKGSGVVLINGQSLTISGAEWKLYQQRVSNVTDLTISSSSTSIYVDELRLHPVDAQMTTYTYQPLIGISSQTDAANRSTYYEYDVFGRLKTIKDDEGNLLKAFEYHYSGQE